MTEPQGGSDPKVFTTRAVRDGDDWVISGWKFFASHAKWAAFFIVMAVTDPDVDIYHGASMFIIPAETPGIRIERNMALFGHEPVGQGTHGLVHFDGVRVPAANVLGGEGQAFAISQTRLGGGRIHHAMRTVGQAKKALDMMVERALSRSTQRSRLADKQSVQNYLADSYAELMQFRLFVLYVAWRIDKLKDYRAVRHDIAAVKVLTPQVLHNIAQRSVQVHGALATTNELPLGEMFSGSMILGLADGPSEVHRLTVARTLLKRGRPAEGMWPSTWLPARQEAARVKYAEYLKDDDDAVDR
jgi:acyl-CoA dehydrogenase